MKIKKWSVLMLLFVLICIGSFWAYNEYQNDKLLQEWIDKLHQEQIDELGTKCECLAKHSKQATIAYKNGHDSLIQEIIIDAVSCEYITPEEIMIGAKEDPWDVYIKNLNSCENYIDKNVIDTMKVYIHQTLMKRCKERSKICRFSFELCKSKFFFSNDKEKMNGIILLYNTCYFPEKLNDYRLYDKEYWYCNDDPNLRKGIKEWIDEHYPREKREVK